MHPFTRLIPVMLVCLAAPAFASDPPTTDQSAKPASPAATPTAAADATSSTNSASPPAKPQQLVLEDKTLLQAEVNRLLSQGYRPQKGRGDAVLYCRSEAQLGSRFEKKVCLTADQIKARTQDSKDATDRMERNSGNPTGK